MGIGELRIRHMPPDAAEGQAELDEVLLRFGMREQRGGPIEDCGLAGLLTAGGQEVEPELPGELLCYACHQTQELTVGIEQRCGVAFGI
jgi:hypothetical protein